MIAANRSWSVIALGELVRDAQSGFASGERATDGVVQLRMNNVTTDGTLDWSNVLRVPASRQEIDKYHLRAGDVLFNSTNSPELVGKTALFRGYPEPVVFSNHFVRLRVDEVQADPRFVASWLAAQRNAGVFQGLCTQWVNQAAVRKEDLLSLELPFPPLPEQQRIAGILARADRLRRLRRHALELSEGYLQAVFVEMFYWNAQPAWPTTRVADLARRGPNAIRTGPFGSQLLHSEFVSEGIAVLGIDNAVNNRFTWGKPRFITEQKYRLLKRYTVLPGDVIITIMGTTGRCAVVPANIPTAINTKHLCCISLNQRQCLPIFLQWCFLAHPYVQQQLGISEKGAIMPGLNMEIIKELRFPLPPIELQQQFASVADRHERLRAQQREALRQAEQLFAALLERAFRGEL